MRTRRQAWPNQYLQYNTCRRAQHVQNTCGCVVLIDFLDECTWNEWPSVVKCPAVSAYDPLASWNIAGGWQRSRVFWRNSGCNSGPDDQLFPIRISRIFSDTPQKYRENSVPKTRLGLVLPYFPQYQLIMLPFLEVTFRYNSNSRHLRRHIMTQSNTREWFIFCFQKLRFITLSQNNAN